MTRSLRRNACGWTLGLMAVLALGFEIQSSGQGAPRPQAIPLCAGLTIVTAVADRRGDYESIKRIESVTADAVRLHYSSERPVRDFLDDRDTGKIERTNVTRTFRRADLERAHAYLQQFSPRLPETSAGTTAIGASADVLNELKTKGQTTLTVFQAFVGPGPFGNPLEREPGTVDYRLSGTVKRIEPGTVSIPVIVNDQRVTLPSIHAGGLLAIEQSEFYFLDDPANPLTLRFTIGRDQLNVVKIAHPPCGPPAAREGGPTSSANNPGRLPQASATSGTAPQIEQALAANGRADVYGIYFDFGSATIKAESEPVLQDIASILAKNVAWKLRVNGHTDNIGGDPYNLDLSNRRAAAVKQALVSRYRVAADRLATAGFGASQPKESNATLEGRARNRRVELVRQ